MFVETLFGFGGRIGRGGYWLVNAVSIPAYVVALLLLPMGSVGLGLFLVTLAAVLATQTKRFHDRDKSGWWCLLALVPLASIWMLVELGCLPGTPGANRYGRPDSGDPRSARGRAGALPGAVAGNRGNPTPRVGSGADAWCGLLSRKRPAP